MESLTLSVSNMSCGHCVKAVTKALSALPNVTVESVTVGEAKISYDPSTLPVASIKKALSEAGYEGTPKDTPLKLSESQTAGGKGSCGCGCH